MRCGDSCVRPAGRLPARPPALLRALLVLTCKPSREAACQPPQAGLNTRCSPSAAHRFVRQGRDPGGGSSAPAQPTRGAPPGPPAALLPLLLTPRPPPVTRRRSCRRRSSRRTRSGARASPGRRRSTGSSSWGWPSTARATGAASRATLSSRARRRRWARAAAGALLGGGVGPEGRAYRAWAATGCLLLQVDDGCAPSGWEGLGASPWPAAPTLARPLWLHKPVGRICVRSMHAPPPELAPQTHPPSHPPPQL